MYKIRCIIVEDEPLAVKVLRDYIEEVPFLEWQATFKDALQALEFLRENSVDLIFLDIHLPRLKGFDFLRTLPSPPAVIVTTAYHQYALEGYNLHVTDYLLKPFEFERFLAAVNKVQNAWQAASEMPEKDYLFLSVQKKKVKVRLSEVLYLESQKEYVKVVTTGSTFLTKMSLQDLEALLPRGKFVRIHRSFVVSLSRIEAYTTESVEAGGVSLPVGRAYREVLERL